MKLTAESKKRVMYDNIRKHGELLNGIFNTGLDPIALCKKLRRLELKAHKLATDYCNGENGITSENIGDYELPILKAVHSVLGDTKCVKSLPVMFNMDCRGYALKLTSEFCQDKNIYKDWGGYGILAPDFRIN